MGLRLQVVWKRVSINQLWRVPVHGMYRAGAPGTKKKAGKIVNQKEVIAATIKAVFEATVDLSAADIQKFRGDTNEAHRELRQSIKDSLALADKTAQVRELVLSAEEPVTLPAAFDWVAKAAEMAGYRGFANKRFHRFNVQESGREGHWLMCTDGFRLHAMPTDLPVGIYAFWGDKAVPVPGEKWDDWPHLVCWDACQVLPAPVAGTYTNCGSTHEAYAWSLQRSTVTGAKILTDYDPEQGRLFVNGATPMTPR